MKIILVLGITLGIMSSSYGQFTTNKPWPNVEVYLPYRNGNNYIRPAGANLNTYFDGNGNVGIGHQNQAAGFRLHVKGESYFEGNVKVAGYLRAEKGIYTPKISFGYIAGSSKNSHVRDAWLTGNNGAPVWNEVSGTWRRPGGTWNDIGGIIYQDEGTYFIREQRGSKLQYTNTEFLNTAYMFADMYTGNIGIGTTKTKDFKLSVDGSLRATEIEVSLSSGWADYVFESNYYLAPLSEVEEYISENKHLPNVPSEKEVTEEGINLGEMDAILLRKIEELTLYMIELKKENEELKLILIQK